MDDKHPLKAIPCQRSSEAAVGRISDGAIFYLRSLTYPASPPVSHRFLLVERKLDNANFVLTILPSHSDMADDELIVRALLKELSPTRYACSDLAKLNGGTANFLYRGTLLEPLSPPYGAEESASKTVVVKHSEGFSPGNRDFLLDITRCVMTYPTFRQLGTCSDLC